MDKPVNEIAQRLGATADQVLLAWVRVKGAVAVTYVNVIWGRPTTDIVSLISLGRAPRNSGWRVILTQGTSVSNNFLASDSLSASTFLPVEITAADIDAIDAAGAKGARQGVFVRSVRVIAELMLFGAVAFRLYTFFAES